MKKTICILLCLLTVCLCLPLASGDAAPTVTYVMPKGRTEQVLLDTDVMTRVTVKNGASITLTLSHAGAGRTAYIEWFSIPADAELQQYDAGNKKIAVTSFRNPDAYQTTVPLDEQCVKVVLAAKKAEYTVSTLFIAEGSPDPSYEWMEQTQACDLMLIVPTPASAMEQFGPILAQYGVAHGVSIAVVVMTVDHRYVAQELQHALLSMGINNAPVYLGCNDQNYLEAKEIHKRWEYNKPADKLNNLIRTLQPKVVVCVGERKNDLRAAETAAIAKSAVPATSTSARRSACSPAVLIPLIKLIRPASSTSSSRPT